MEELQMDAVCRFCGAIKPRQDFIQDINEQQEENLSLKDYILIYCRIELSPNPDLPTKVCRLCRIQLEVHIAFCDNLNRVETNLQSQVREKSGKIDLADVFLNPFFLFSFIIDCWCQNKRRKGCSQSRNR